MILENFHNTLSNKYQFYSQLPKIASKIESDKPKPTIDITKAIMEYILFSVSFDLLSKYLIRPTTPGINIPNG
jgi:hypothetical protein